MAGEVDAGDSPAIGAAGVDVDEPEGDRQAALAVDDAHQIGIGHVVIGHPVAVIAEITGDDVGEGLGPGAGDAGLAAGGTRGLGIGTSKGRSTGRHVLGDAGQMGAVGIKHQIRHVRGAERQGGFGQINRVVGGLSGGAQNAVELGGHAHGSRWWLTAPGFSVAPAGEG